MAHTGDNSNQGRFQLSRAELDTLRPTFSPMLRVAQSLFDAFASDIVIAEPEGFWRSADPDRLIHQPDPATERIVRTQRPLWIADITLDPSYKDGPLVTGPPYFRSVAGAPVILASGQCIGALGVVGVRQRERDVELEARLADLASCVANECDRFLALRERDAALDRMARTQERLAVACEIADVHVYEIDYVEGAIRREGAADTGLARLLSFEELRDDIWAGVHPDDVRSAKDAWRAHLKDGSPYRAEYRTQQADGRENWVCATARLLQDEAGRPRRLIGALHNITDRKRTEAAMAQALEAAGAANQAKSAFLATITHEIRTPLNGVLGMAQVMVRDELPPRQRERLEIIHDQGERLLALLNDLLDLSKVEAGKLTLEDGVVEIGRIAHDIQATFTALASAKDLYFTLSVDPEARGCWRGDPARVGQILRNLVANAVKFTDQGSVQVDIRWTEPDLVFRIQDTGVGIAPDRTEGLFDRFVQADPSTTRRFGGSGLGLAICRDLAGAMGGKITVDSRPGQGSTFTVRLPLPRLADETRPEPVVVDGGEAVLRGGLRILAAEDNPVNQRVLSALLAAVGVEPTIVSNGEEALEAWGQGNWDLILMDVQMPVLDGLAAASAIRAREAAEGRPRTPIVALTANAMTHHRAAYVTAGMDRLVAKPIQLHDLLSAINELFQPGRGEAAA